MEMEVRSRAEWARIARDRLYAAIPGQDLETGQALWRAMGRYNERMKFEARTARLEAAGAPLAALEGGSGQDRELG